MEPFVGAVAGAVVGLLVSLRDHGQKHDKCRKETMACPVTYAVMAFGAAFGGMVGIVASIFGSWIRLS